MITDDLFKLKGNREVKWFDRMRECAKLAEEDPERAHPDADEILCEILISEGYEELVDIYKSMTRWYS